ncbi:hypothetical protein GCM10008090_17730 [Arenicella chitinivorans]|uniref:O-antigen ligase-related domain-containing protein n=1 Tax=Arenicella chitinivorans TaxID=1329800 RepID=A0A918VM23_9GAMM|nr:O-antigen ligase family protein [Arenicella chitinivorans]GHA08326.1 hypothetical protein GCM10008090_17730 [Arenicella chitinivorans]
MMATDASEFRIFASVVGKLLDQFAWWSFLLLLAVSSFIDDIYPSKHWLLITAGFCFALTLHLFGTALGARCNYRGIRSSAPVVGLFAVGLLWLVLQILVPAQHYGHELLLSNALDKHAAPPWFNPNLSWSVTPIETRHLLFSELICLLALLLMLSMLCTRQRLRQVLLIVTIVAGVHAVSAITAKYADTSLVDTAQLDGHFTVARGWFINRNHLASFLILTSVGWMSVFLHRCLRSDTGGTLIARIFTKRMLVSIPSVMVMVLIVIAVTLTSSRAGIVSVLILFLVFALTTMKRNSQARWTLSLLAGMTLFVSLLVVYFGEGVLQRFSGQEGLLGERGEQWQATWLLIKHNVLLGYGGNSYATLFQMVRDNDGLRQLIYNQAHNDYLHIWFEQGIVGLALWLGVIAVTFYKGIASLKRTQSTLVAAAIIASLATLGAALMQSLVDFNLQILSIRIYFFVIIAIVVSVPSIRHIKLNDVHVRSQ